MWKHLPPCDLAREPSSKDSCGFSWRPWPWKLGCWRDWPFLAGLSATRWPRPCWGHIAKSSAPIADIASRAASIRVPSDRRRFAQTAAMPTNDLLSLPVLHGDRLLIDRTAFSLRQPRRWEVAALRHPQRANDILVKRIVGLPGESIEIRDGDVYADGQIQRKNLAQQHALAILVHDADCRPTLEPTARPRWRGEGPDSRWESADAGFSHPGDARRRADRLARLPSSAASCRTGRPWKSRSPTSAATTSRSRAATKTFMPWPICCFRSGSNRPATARSSFGRPMAATPSRFGCVFWKNERETWQYEAFQNGKPIAEASGSVQHADRQLVEVSLIDQQFMLALDGRTVVAWPYERRGFAAVAPAVCHWRARAGGNDSRVCGCSETSTTPSRSVPGRTQHAAAPVSSWRARNTSSWATTARFPTTAAPGPTEGLSLLSYW